MKLYPPILLVLTIVVAGIGLFSWSLYKDKHNSLDAQQSVIQTHNSIDRIDETGKLIYRNESAMRAFAVTGNSLFLNEYSSNASAIDHHLSVMDKQFARNPAQMRNLAQLRADILEKRKFEMQLQDRGNSPAKAAELIASLEGKMLMDKISAALLQMKVTENLMLQQGIVHNRNTASTSYRNMLIGAAVALLFTIATLLRLNRDIVLRRRTEKKLSESETKYRGLIENAGMVSFTCDNIGHFNFISNQVIELTGFAVSELLGKHFTTLIAPDHMEDVAGHFYRQGKELTPSTSLTFPIIHKSGRVKWVEQDTIVILKKGEHVGFQSVVKDVTEKVLLNQKMQELKREQKEFQQTVKAILDNTPLAIYVKDLGGRYILVNKKFSESFDVSEEEIIGKTIFEIDHQTKAERHIEADRLVVESGQHVELEDVFYFGEEENHVLTIKFPLLDEENRVFGIGGFMKDITETVRYRDELIAARQRAESAEMLQEQFLANMSHEIRTPMNGIIGMTNLLQKTTLQPKQKEYVQIVKQSSDNLLVLINDILDLSKIKAGKISIEKIPFAINERLKVLTASFKLKAEEKGIRFSLLIHPAVPQAIKGDPHRLTQILGNLLSNSMKFTEKGYVTLEVSVAESIGNSVTLNFQVIDTGIGIDEKNISYIFESFAQASASTTRKYGGTGLGLAITKRLIEIQGGEISISSKPGAGSTFTVTMPFETSSMIDVHESIMPISKPLIDGFDLSDKVVLIVEDNEINRIVLHSNLKQYNLTVAMAQNGYEAVEYLRNNPADLVLMDLHMPEMDGFEATETIREKLRLDVPIVVLTASALKNERQRSIEFGANDYLTKPFSPEELQGCLEKYLAAPADKQKIVVANTRAEAGGFDLSILMQMGDKEAISTLHRMFEQLVPENLGKLKENVMQQDWEQVRFISHKLKSSFGVIHIHDIYRNMSEVEILAKERRELETILSMVDDSIAMYHEVMPSVRTEIEKQIA